MKSIEENRAKFLTRVNITEDCWLWKGKPTPDGYGNITSLRGFTSKVTNPHRMSYMLFVGDIAPGLEIDHLCRNRICVRPEHLEAVTNSVNNERVPKTSRKGRKLGWRKEECKRGHALNFENTETYQCKGREYRRCRLCRPFRPSSINRYHDTT